MQVDYTAYGNGYQVCLPISTEIKIPKDDPVRLLSAIVERMDIKALEATYSEDGRDEYPPRILLKITQYGYMRKIISSREQEKACHENINFMYLLGGRRAPDHNTIARFRSKHLAKCQKEIMVEMVRVLQEMEEVSFEKSAVFIDGTKIESVGNRYQFVWKKGVEKNYERLQENIREELPRMLNEIGIKVHVGEGIKLHQLKKIRKKIVRKMKDCEIVRVSGKGKHKSKIQRTLERIEAWIERIRKYISQIHICGDRNSYCKTDTEATFMRMKEDHMLNGQLKPGYNVNVATVSEYVVGIYVSSDRTDTRTTIPFMEELRSVYKIHRVVYDSGYESEENYRYFEKLKETDKIEMYVKPSNHEQKKRRKYKTDISRRENMGYDPQKDVYICASGNELQKTGIRRTKTASGYVSEKSIYECGSCSGCPNKEKCIRSKSKQPLEERNKRIEVAQYFDDQRKKMEAKITTDEGKQLRMNRSIQSEGVFAYTKTDLQFRRFMTKGITKVGAEWTLLAMAYNVLKLHHKTIAGRLGTHLFDLSAS